MKPWLEYNGRCVSSGRGRMQMGYMLTDWTEFSMVLANTLNCMELQLDALSRPQLCQHNVRVGGCWSTFLKHICLIACRTPCQHSREEFVVIV